MEAADEGLRPAALQESYFCEPDPVAFDPEFELEPEPELELPKELPPTAWNIDIP
ncbi:hypothetical protein [Bradyrhizobium sp. P5_C11_2]